MLRRPRPVSLGLLVLGVLAAGVPAWGPPPLRAAPAEDLVVDQPVRDRVLRDGQARVLVKLRLPSGRLSAEGALPSEGVVAAQRAGIASSRSSVLTRLRGTRHAVARSYRTVPLLALTIGADALAQLEASGQLVSRVMPDALRAPMLTQSVPLAQGDQAWAAGYDGTGTTVAILDTGVDDVHPFLANKVVDQACFSSTVPFQSTSVCPDGQDEQIGPGAGVPCPLLGAGCWHGTHVAGIAAGNGAPAGQPFSGVAKGATIIAVQVFSRVDSVFLCGGAAPCMQAWVSDIIAGLDHVYSLRDQHNLASVNLSLGGGGPFTLPCDTEPEKASIDNLRSVGIATVIAAGNDGSVNGLTSPGCISTAVSVGATTKSDVVASFSNVASFLSVFAPGQSIQSSYAGGGWATASGTSMATPHVTGALAVLKQAAPSATVDEMLAALQQTGTPITDTRIGGTVTRPRIQILDALLALNPSGNPAPALDSLNPSSAAASGAAFTLEVDGSNFVPASVIRWNGASRPTTFVNGGRLRAGITASDLATQGTAQVTVFTPQPGGGTSSSLAFTITPPGPGCPASVIVDNLPPGQSSAQVSFTGSWSTAAQSGPFGANGSLFSSGIGADTYTWRTPVFATAQACTYQVSVWWTAGPQRSPSAPYTVSGQTGGAVTKTFDQRFGGGQWILHGTYTFPAGAMGQVTLTDQNGKVAADAVRFVLVGAADGTPPSTTITAGPTGTIGVTTATFTWSGSDDTTPTGSLLYAFRLDPLETSFSAFASAVSKTYAGLPDGSYTFYAQARDQASNVTQPPASRSFTVSTGASSPCPGEVIVDNLPPGQSSAQVSFTGSWSTAAQSGPFGANGSLFSSGIGADTYTWKTPVFTTAQACTYRVYVWWTAGPQRSPSAPYTVSGQTGGAVTRTFDQRFGGGQWILHGTYAFPAGAMGRTTLTDQNGKVAADAVRFVLVP